MPSKGSRENISTKEENKEALLQSDHCNETLLQVFTEHNQGKAVLEIVVRIATVTLVSYPGEKDLQVSYMLLGLCSQLCLQILYINKN